ncbi:MAG: hypothetical protein ABI162_18580 [Luteolibacter sp.]
MYRATVFPLFAASMGLVSCAALSTAGKNSVAMIQKTSAAATATVSDLSDKLHPAGVKVVAVREKDLKELPTGQERAMAFESSRKSGFWFFKGPVDFKEPNLPEAGAEMDGSLLPPKLP